MSRLWPAMLGLVLAGCVATPKVLWKVGPQALPREKKVAVLPAKFYVNPDEPDAQAFLDKNLGDRFKRNSRFSAVETPEELLKKGGANGLLMATLGQVQDSWLRMRTKDRASAVALARSLGVEGLILTAVRRWVRRGGVTVQTTTTGGGFSSYREQDYSLGDVCLEVIWLDGASGDRIWAGILTQARFTLDNVGPFGLIENASATKINAAMCIHGIMAELESAP